MLLSRLLGRTTDALVEGISTPKNYRDRFFLFSSPAQGTLPKSLVPVEDASGVVSAPCTRGGRFRCCLSASGGYFSCGFYEVATNAYTFAIVHTLRECHPGADGQPRRLRGPRKWIFFIPNTLLKLFPNLTRLFFFRKLTLLAAPRVMARSNTAAPAAASMTWRRFEMWAMTWLALSRHKSWRGSVAPRATARQRRLQGAATAPLPSPCPFYPLAAATAPSLGSSTADPSRISPGPSPPSPPSPPSLPSPKLLLGLGHGKDALICL